MGIIVVDAGSNLTKVGRGGGFSLEGIQWNRCEDIYHGIWRNNSFSRKLSEDSHRGPIQMSIE